MKEKGNSIKRTEDEYIKSIDSIIFGLNLMCGACSFLVELDREHKPVIGLYLSTKKIRSFMLMIKGS